MQPKLSKTISVSLYKKLYFKLIDTRGHFYHICLGLGKMLTMDPTLRRVQTGGGGAWSVSLNSESV